VFSSGLPPLLFKKKRMESISTQKCVLVEASSQFIVNFLDDKGLGI
jgi:hypothetical protein